MIAVNLHPDVVLGGVAIPPHRTLEVVDELDVYGSDDERTVLTPGQARALVQAGLATPIGIDFDDLPGLVDAWERT